MSKTTSRQRESQPVARFRWRKLKGIATALGLLSLLAGCEATLGTGGGSGAEPGTIDENGNKVFASSEFNLDGSPYYSRAILLTNSQWANSVENILNLDAKPTQANSFLKPVQGFTMFTNNERVLKVTNQMREAYQLAAAEIAQDILADPNGVARINAGNDADTFIRTFGRRAFRRPLREEEVAGYKELYDIGVGLSGDQSDFVKGANLVVEGMLQSPHFLYRTELTPDGARLTGYEIASKLSFWLLGTSPSDALLDRAAAGEFDTPEGVSAVVDDMLADPRASDVVVDLFAELFNFSQYENIIKEDPQYDPAVNDELETVSRLFFRHIYEQNLGLDEILQSTKGFVGPQLADYYGVSPAPAAPTLTELGPERAGYFSQVPYLMMMGDGSHSDAIHRGVFLHFHVMCAELPSPPGDIPEVPEPEPNQTDRERIEAHTGLGTCGEGCHAGYINPLGYAFETFDGLGRMRDMDNGKPVNTAAAYPIGDQGMVPFDGAPELMSVLAGSSEANSCLAKSMMSYALARDIVGTDRALLDELAAISMSETGSLKEILKALATSPTFLTRPGAL